MNKEAASPIFFFCGCEWNFCSTVQPSALMSLSSLTPLAVRWRSSRKVLYSATEPPPKLKARPGC